MIHLLKSCIRTNPATPPTAFEKAVFDTPLRSSSVSQRGTEQTHDEVDQRILEELTGRVYYDVGGCFERYFERKCVMSMSAGVPIVELGAMLLRREMSG